MLKEAEPLIGTTGRIATVLDFWKWAYSDINANRSRSVLAGYNTVKHQSEKLPIGVCWSN